MTPEEGMRIYSNDYADLLIRYSGDQSILQKFTNSTFQIIDFFFAVVHVPVDQITSNTIVQMGYSVIPSVLGLASQLSLEASGITQVRNIPNFNLRGQGVLIGILDTGIDYTNPIFRYPDNTTKIVSIWDQTIHSEDYSTNTYFGTAYTREQINEALKSDQPFTIVPSKDENGHGTMLAGIAAGNEVPESNFSGVVPDAELIVVKLKPAKANLKEFWMIPESAVCYQENDILFALEYLEQAAIQLNRPMSICVALGSSLGAHDERGSLTNNISIRAENLSFSIAVAAGNEGNAKRHFSALIDPSAGFETVELNVGIDESNFAMELWGNSPGLYAIDIKTPSGEYIPKIIPRLNETREITFIFELTRIQIDYQIVESQSGDQLILFRFTKPAPGIWTFKVYGEGDINLGFNIWLPMTGFISNNTYFLKPDPFTTLLSLANATMPITVTAYDPSDDSLYLDSGKGYTRTNQIKPDIAAPGVNILSPSLSQGFVAVTGTSPATAHTAGIAAMILEWAVVKKSLPYISPSVIKALMIKGAKRDPNIKYPNKEWGFGILDIYQVFDSLRNIL